MRQLYKLCVFFGRTEFDAGGLHRHLAAPHQLLSMHSVYMHIFTAWYKTSFTKQAQLPSFLLNLLDSWQNKTETILLNEFNH